VESFDNLDKESVLAERSLLSGVATRIIMTRVSTFSVNGFSQLAVGFLESLHSSICCDAHRIDANT
jgi:hypothetical protein